ncbi:MAG: MscL family protein, partial [Eggerthellaceae bacterium]
MEKSKGLIAEFKEFINQGNAMDMAVGVIIGGAFTAIVNSLIDDIINPVISIVTGGGEVGQGLSIQIGSAVINFGSLIG